MTTTTTRNGGSRRPPTASRILSHPLRAQILQVIGDGRLSPKDIAEAVGAPLSNTSYHVRQLAEAGALKLVGRAVRRGAVEHFYEVTPGVVRDALHPEMLTIAARTLTGKSEEEWGDLSAAERRAHEERAAAVVTSYLVGKPGNLLPA